MNKVRFGIVGLGNIGRQHADYLLAGKVSRGELAAVCSSSPEKLAAFQTRGMKTFSRFEEMYRSGAIDAVIVATPHHQHPAQGMAAFESGLHLMMEKPLAAHRTDAEKLAAAHRDPRLVFAAMFQMRAEPRYQKIRELIQTGQLGKLVRFIWINTDWFRTGAYYASGGWRASWRGEGGGVLLNQSLHNLDMLGWLCGAPQRLQAFCQMGKFHDIEVEDDVTAWLEWPGGATGAFISSTGEAPGTNRLEIAGTLGKLVFENNKIVLTRNAGDMTVFSRTSKEGFVKPDSRTEEVSFATLPNPHAALTQNFVDAILDGAPLLAPGAEGVLSVELANAMVYSSSIGKRVDLPLDGAAWQKKLDELIAQSDAAKTTR